jgi:hypothetical protein
MMKILMADMKTKYTPAQARDMANERMHKSIEPLRAAVRSLADQVEALEAQLATVGAGGVQRLVLEQTPFGWWHEGETYEESDFYLASESGDVACPNCIPLYTEDTK